MKIAIVTPPSTSPLNGNSVTARRYAAILKRLGHRVTRLERYEGHSADLIIALHAGKSHDSIVDFRRTHPRSPLIVVLTGTDLYRDIDRNGQVSESLRLASRIVVLQERALDEIAPRERRKAAVIYQSVERYRGRVERPAGQFRIAVVANLREEKDPLRAAKAARSLPESSGIRVVHCGQALSRRFSQDAAREMRRNPRYRWLGAAAHWKARRLIAGSHMVAITSRMEGSSNVLGEALSSGTPVIASHIPGIAGTLGNDYPGYFPVGDTAALASLMQRAELDNGFYSRLRKHCARAAPLVRPGTEVKAWAELLNGLDP
ncbi:MAG TPA: selenoneine biosynthesis selenosugar synthase SenB [Blastocatellia bacterium]|nr:selenoneine biosynthesis selenosugar synthase SenB [Blastocatellia bacterium]